MRSGYILAGAAALSACASSGAATANPPVAAASERQVTYVATLTPTNASGNRITGRIRLVPSARPGELTAEVDLRGGAYQNKYQWMIRSGQCGEPGQELGTALAYRLIETRGDGMSQMKIPLRLTIPEGGTHHVALFASATNRNLVVSCGVLSPEVK